MIYKIKALGLGLLAVMAIGAVTASGAQAGSLDIIPVQVLTGHSLASQEHVLTLTNTKGEKFNAKCTTASFEGTAAELTITEATVTATYSSCKLFNLAAQVLMNGCRYTFTGAEQPANTAVVDIVSCTAGKKIQIKNLTCTLTIGEQNGLAHVNFENAGGSPQDIVAQASLSGITVTQDGAGCPDGNGHTSTSATSTGSATVMVFEGNGTTQVTLHGHQYAEHLHSGQASLVAT